MLNLGYDLSNLDEKDVVLNSALQLVRVASKYGMLARDIPNNPEYLDEADLRVRDCTAAVLAKASMVEHRWSETINQRVKEYNAQFEEEKPELFLPEQKQDQKKKLFGYPVTAVIRWMGVEGWTTARAGKALAAMNFKEVAIGTITAQLAAGRKGERGEPAKLTDDQANQLYDVSG